VQGPVALTATATLLRRGPRSRAPGDGTFLAPHDANQGTTITAVPAGNVTAAGVATTDRGADGHTHSVKAASKGASVRSVGPWKRAPYPVERAPFLPKESTTA
jgi:hypothetical protein